jgi:xylose isomerase
MTGNSAKRYSVILGNLGNTRDRFMSCGYKQTPGTRKMIEQAATIEGLSGLELVSHWDLTPQNQQEVRAMLRDHGLTCASVLPELFSRPQWGRGALGSRDTAIRQAAIDEIAINAELAASMNCDLVTIWPGQDGYDYPLQDDYLTVRGWIRDSIATVASRFPAIRFALEYKLKEPRTHSYIARVADTVLLARDTGLSNVGVCIDTGHALMAYENLGEAAVIAGDRLFHMHFNDNFRAWDDDMIVGSVHTIEHIELLYWLDRLGYRGWYSMDQYPYREDGRDAVQESIHWMRGYDRIVREHQRQIDQLLVQGDAVKTSAFLRKVLLTAPSDAGKGHESPGVLQR